VNFPFLFVVEVDVYVVVVVDKKTNCWNRIVRNRRVIVKKMYDIFKETYYKRI
jgi:hypothetical protein